MWFMHMRMHMIHVHMGNMIKGKITDVINNMIYAGDRKIVHVIKH